MNVIEKRIAEVIRGGPIFTADDVTMEGVIAIDQGHAPNARQNAIGSTFQALARRGLIQRTGRVVRSKAPHRKGGMIQVWQATAAGRRWAAELQ